MTVSAINEVVIVATVDFVVTGVSIQVVDATVTVDYVVAVEVRFNRRRALYMIIAFGAM